MAIHQNLKPSDQEIPLLLAGQALSRVDGLVSRPMGAVSVDNVDGSSTLIGGNTDTGTGDSAGAGDVSGGVITQVGKTSLPGTPNGLSVSSVGLTVMLTWDGSFTDSRGGAVRVEAVLTDADGKTISMGSLTGAGVLTALATVPGMASVAVTAYDDAHDESGVSAPNHSDTVTLDIVLSELVDSKQITDTVEENRKTLDQANKDLAQAKTDIAAAASTAQSAKTTADKAVSDAVKAVSDAASATSAASTAQRNAATALTNANTALQRAKNITVSSTAPANPTMGDIWYPQDYSGRVIGMKTWGGSWWEDVTIMAGSIIVPGSVGSTLIADGAVSTSKIIAGSITGDKLAANTVNADKLAANSVTADKIAANAVNADKLAANSVTVDKLAANSVTANKLAANSVTADKIAANSITADKIRGNRLVGAQIQTNENAPYMLMTSQKFTVNPEKVDSYNSGVIQFIGKNNSVMGGLSFDHTDSPNNNMGARNGYSAYLTVTNPNKPNGNYANQIEISDIDELNSDNRRIDISSKYVSIGVNENGNNSWRDYKFSKDGLSMLCSDGSSCYLSAHRTLFHNDNQPSAGVITLDDDITKYWKLEFEFKTNDGVYFGMPVYRPSVGKRFNASTIWYGFNNLPWLKTRAYVFESSRTLDCVGENGNTYWRTGQQPMGAGWKVTNGDYISVTHVEGFFN